MTTPQGVSHSPLAEEARASRRAYFEGLYQHHEEPWEYSERAPEILRHELVVRTASALSGGSFHRILDLGCSLGQLTSRLVGLAEEVHALDLSPTAVEQARVRCWSAARAQRFSPNPQHTAFRFYVASVMEPPFRSSSFDLLLLCDGLVSWQLTAEEQQAALETASQMVVPGGYVILTEALKQFQIDSFIERVERSPLEVTSVRYLNDRLWFSLHRAARPIHHWRLIQAAFGSRRVAKALAALARLAGKRGTKHICILARRPLPSGEGL